MSPLNPPGNYVVVYEAGETRHKLVRVVFGPDGSYYVTCPYDTADDERAAFLMQTINYAFETIDLKLEDAIDIGAADDPDRGVKLSHHPSGFVQFSGPGLTSGLDEDGTPSPRRGQYIAAPLSHLVDCEPADHVLARGILTRIELGAHDALTDEVLVLARPLDGDRGSRELHFDWVRVVVGSRNRSLKLFGHR